MLPNELSLEDRRLFWRNYDKWCAMFTQELVDEQLAKLSVMSIVDEHQAPLQTASGSPRRPHVPYEMHRHLGTRHTYHRFVNEDGWEKSVFVPCELYMVPARYQSTKHDEIIKPIMHKLYPWLAEFVCHFYSLNFYGSNHVEEFYVNTTKEYGPRGGHKSLYVPYEAMKTHDIAAVEKRNAEYLRSYTGGNATWNAMREDPNVIAFFLKM